MRSGLIVREVRESIIGSRLGPALTVRFVRVHEGSLEARTPPHPPHPPAPPAPLLHPLHTPHAPHAHPMHTPCTPWCGAGRRRSSRRGCTQSAAQPDLGHRDRCAAGRPPATEPRSVTDPEPDTPTPLPRPRHPERDTPSTGLPPHRLLPAAALLRQAELYVFTPAKGSRHELRLRFADSEAA